MGLKAAVQALKKAEPLKDKVQRCKDLLNDNDAWTCQRQLQKIYQQVLILDLEYALDRKVEQELWNLGFKNYIALLQSQAKDRRNPKRGESQAMLSWCLEAASGFYLTLLQEICTAFDLDLPFRRKSYVYGCISPWKAVEKLSAPHKSSCFYACQYCLVHLGDIARYRNQNKQAELFYRHAVSLSPSSGQPYNQLALLEASRGDKLGTVFHYVRSVAVKHPFPVAIANLAKTLSSALNDSSFSIEGKTKLSSQEYITVFLKFHGMLYNLGDLSVAASFVKLLNETLTALVATESFKSWRLVQMLVINLYALQHTAGVPSETAELLKTEQLSSDEKVSKNYILDLIAGSLSALLLPVYTIKNALINYFALPTIKLCLDWIQLKPAILEEVAFTSRLQIWPSLCVLLNGLQSCVTDFDYNMYAKIPLPEDRDLQGFLPLEKSFETLRFTNTDLEGDTAMLNKLRAMRILQLGRRLAQVQVNGASLISISAGDQNGEQKFTSAFEGTGLSSELIKELEELSLNKEKQPIVADSPVPSETASSKGSSEVDSLIAELGLEKRGGILKPQGSLERNRDTNDLVINTENNSQPSSARKPRQNVAMQAIMRRAENEQKQVTFKNVSPAPDEIDKIKLSGDPAILMTSTASSQPVKNNIKSVVVSSSTTNGIGSNIINAPVIQPRPPLMPNVPLNIQHKQPSVAQPQHLPQQSESVRQQQQLQQPQQPQQPPHPPQHQQQQQQQVRENLLFPPSVVKQYPMGDLQTPGLAASSTLNLNQFPPPPQGPLSQTSACYSNQPFNVQTPQFNKNFIANPAASLQQYNVSTSLPGQFGSGQPASNQAIPYPPGINVNQSRLLQQSQPQAQQWNNFAPLSQNNPVLTQGLNLPNAQSQQSIVQNMALAMQQNPFENPNGLGMQNHKRVRPNAIEIIHPPSAYQGNLPEGGMNNVTTPNMQQPLNFVGSTFGQNNFGQLQPQQQQQQQQQHQQHQQQQKASFAVLPTKSYNPWAESLPRQQLPVTWNNSNNIANQVLQQQGGVKDIPYSDALQNWSNSSNPGNQRMNSMPLTPGNNYPPNSIQGWMYNGRNNFDDLRPFDMDQKSSQLAQMGSTYSLFSNNSWGANGQLAAGTVGGGGMSSSSGQQPDQMKARLNQQSLWSGPGPSPLERLLEQQKSLREGGT